MRTSKDDEKDRLQRVFGDQEEAELAESLKPRVLAAAADPRFLDMDRDALRRVVHWALRFGIRDELGTLVRDHIRNDPARATKLLIAFASVPYSMESGLELPPDFEKDAYDLATTLVPAGEIAGALRNRFPGIQPQDVRGAPSSMDPEMRVARHFLHLLEVAAAAQRRDE